MISYGELISVLVKRVVEDGVPCCSLEVVIDSLEVETTVFNMAVKNAFPDEGVAYPRPGRASFYLMAIRELPVEDVALKVGKRIYEELGRLRLQAPVYMTPLENFGMSLSL